MFDPVVVTHHDIVARLLAIRDRIGIEQVTDAFLASLSTRRLELRSALGSFSVAANFRDHRLIGQACGPCRLCGLYDHSAGKQEHLNVLSFERWKWGGVRHLNPLYRWFDLMRFEKESLAAPTLEDYLILARIIEIASGLPPKAKPTELEKRIGKAIKSNSSERRVLIEILGYCGVLKPAVRCGFLQTFTSDEHRNRDRPSDHTNDWSYPVIWWQGTDGVDRDALNRLFPKIAAVFYNLLPHAPAGRFLFVCNWPGASNSCNAISSAAIWGTPTVKINESSRQPLPLGGHGYLPQTMSPVARSSLKHPSR